MVSYVRILCPIQSQENLQLFFPKTFMILALIFRILIHFDVYGCEVGVQLNFFAYGISVVSAPITTFELKKDISNR